MKHTLKRILYPLLAIVLMFSLSACGGSGELLEQDILELTKGNIDAIYLGEFTEEYLEITASTEAELEQIYQEGLTYEAEFFATYWGIIDASVGETFTDLGEDLRNRIIDLYKEIYSHSKYEVVSAAQQDEACYTVKVTVAPIDIMEQAYNVYVNDENEGLVAFWEKHAATDFSTMTEEDYNAYTNEYGHAVVQMIEDLLPSLGYGDEKSQSLQVELVDEYWTLNEDDLGVFDSYVIAYP